jgi:hypothetical protein
MSTVIAKATKRLVVCVNNARREVLLERCTIYVVLPDRRTEELREVRVID